MKFVRPKLKENISIEQKSSILREYFDTCSANAKLDPRTLNQKIPREQFSVFLNNIGCSVNLEAKRISTEDGAVKDFLSKNPLPSGMKDYLPDEFRAYSLLLNALKQWISAEQAATDRFLLGGSAKNLLKTISSKCIISDKPLFGEIVELHHTLRDGRPPIPILKVEHDKLESQSSVSDDPVMALVYKIKRERNSSWILLREGLEYFQAIESDEAAVGARPNGKSFAKKAIETTKLSVDQLLEWMNENDL